MVVVRESSEQVGDGSQLMIELNGDRHHGSHRGSSGSPGSQVTATRQS
jgi:hypothetical protein